MRRATTADAAAITSCLRTAPHNAMFPLGFLQRDGFMGAEGRRLTFWVNKGGNEITDVMALSNAGIALPFLPNATYLGAVRALENEAISGIIGPRDQVRALRSLLGLDDSPVTLDQEEPHFALSLGRLRTPEGPGVLRPLSGADRATMLDWMTDYQIRTLLTPPDKARDMAEAGYERALAADNRRVLMAGKTPLAMTAFNAQLPDIVQIGGVYTPPEQRSNGYARRAVALHLEEARSRGVIQATLSAANPAAERAYESIGFKRVGHWAFVLFADENANG